MKGLFTKITAVLLVVWYLMSIIGFDVHTCSGSGQSFVVTFVEGFSCEDVHPEHRCTKDLCCSAEKDSCHSHGCCHHHPEQECQLSAKSCCSSDYQVLALTGTSLDERNDGGEQNLTVIIHTVYSDIFELGEHHTQLISHIPAPDFSPGRMPDIQAVLGVWRI